MLGILARLGHVFYWLGCIAAVCVFLGIGVSVLATRDFGDWWAKTSPFATHFNIEAARKDGLSDTDIAEHLAQRAGFNIAAARKDGIPDKEIAEYLAPRA